MSAASRYPEPRGAIKARVVAAVDGGMRQDDVTSLARATGLTLEQVRSALRNMTDPRLDRRPPAPRPSGVRLRVVSGHMEAGAGDRRPECTSYELCLSGWADVHSGDAHCPPGCERRSDADREREFLHLAASRPRAEHAS